MSISAISRRYAKALVELGAEQNMVEQYSQELSQLTSVFDQEDVLRLLLESPTYDLDKKSAILSDVTGALKFSEGMKNFLGLLLEKDRLRCLSLIAADYRRLADERSNILRARITSAAELDAGQADAIKSGLEKATGKQVELTVGQNPDMIGGIAAEFGGRVFDGSVRTQLKRIEDTLKKG